MRTHPHTYIYTYYTVETVATIWPFALVGHALNLIFYHHGEHFFNEPCVILSKVGKSMLNVYDQPLYYIASESILLGSQQTILDCFLLFFCLAGSLIAIIQF